MSYNKGIELQDQNVSLLTPRLKVSSFLVPEINKAYKNGIKKRRKC